jgi:TonB family protein
LPSVEPEQHASSTDPLRDPQLLVEVQFQISRQGTISHLAISHSSGLLEFDTAALEALLLAFPVTVPYQLVRSVETTRVVWLFSRNPLIACTTYNSRLIPIQRTPYPTSSAR